MGNYESGVMFKDYYAETKKKKTLELPLQSRAMEAGWALEQIRNWGGQSTDSRPWLRRRADHGTAPQAR